MKNSDREELRKMCFHARNHGRIAMEVQTILNLLDALDEALAEKEHYELLAESRGKQVAAAEREAKETSEELEHFVQSTFVDAGANPAIAWKDRCLEAERKLAEAEQAISALGKAAADSYDCGIRP